MHEVILPLFFHPCPLPIFSAIIRTWTLWNFNIINSRTEFSVNITFSKEHNIYLSSKGFIDNKKYCQPGDDFQEAINCYKKCFLNRTKVKTTFVLLFISFTTDSLYSWHCDNIWWSWSWCWILQLLCHQTESDEEVVPPVSGPHSHMRLSHSLCSGSVQVSGLK